MSFEIERVIIRGEMPEGCEDCDRHEGVYVSCWDGAKPTMYAVDCSVANITHDWEVDYASRPNRCPLVKYCEICDGVGFVLHASKGTIPCPECSKESEG